MQNIHNITTFIRYNITMAQHKYYIASKTDREIILKQEIPRQEYKILIKGSSILEPFLMAKCHYDIVMSNYKELQEYQKFTKHDAAIGKIKSRNDADKYLFNTNRLLFNYLASFRTFVDNLQHMYAPKIQNGKTFEKETITKIYEKKIIYAFFYKLRNYAVHFGIVADHMSIKINDINFYCSRKSLLRFKGWKPETRKFIESLPDLIDIEPFIKQHSKYIKNIFSSFITAMLPEFSEILNLRKIIKERYDTSDPIYLIETDKNGLPISYNDLGGEALNQLKRMGDLTRLSLYT